MGSLCVAPITALGGVLVDGAGQLLDLRGLDVAGLLVGRHLGVAEALVVSLGVGLLHQLHDEVLDHLLDLAEGVRGRVRGDDGKELAAGLLGAGLEEVHDLGWHYLSNATCLIWPRLFYMSFVVWRHDLLHYSPLLKKTCVRQSSVGRVVGSPWRPSGAACASGRRRRRGAGRARCRRPPVGRRGFQGHRFEDTVKGHKFEETRTQIFLNICPPRNGVQVMMVLRVLVSTTFPLFLNHEFAHDLPHPPGCA